MRNHRVDPSDRGLEELLSSAQAGSAKAADALVMRHNPTIQTIAFGVAKKLGVPRQDWEDVLQETYRRLLDPSTRPFSRERGAPESYIYGEALNAVGHAKRRRHGEYRSDLTEGQTAGVLESMWGSDAFEEPHRVIEVRMTVVSLLGRAEPVVKDALAEIIRNDVTQREAAQVVGLSEFQLSRRLRSFYTQARAAA